MKLDIIAGARPNFMKIGPIIHAIQKRNEELDTKIEYRLVHTGQHYDKAMSESFFEQLNIPAPDINLGAGGGTQAEQTAAIMIGYEKALEEWTPDLCMVVGDVTSTMACAIVAKKAHVKVAHVEAGIRSGDIKMPEEINRIVTDSLADYYFTTTPSAGENLIAEGATDDQILFVGNTMIDSLNANLTRIVKPDILSTSKLETKDYMVATLHRPSNVDGVDNLSRLLAVINEGAAGKKVVFPMHPRTKQRFDAIDATFDNIIVTGPMPYLEFVYLIKHSAGVITDSGGITEETTVLGIPCMTLRDSTERPETVKIGTNELIGTDIKNVEKYLKIMTSGEWKQGSIPEKWDGQTSERIVEALLTL